MYIIEDIFPKGSVFYKINIKLRPITVTSNQKDKLIHKKTYCEPVSLVLYFLH